MRSTSEAAWAIEQPQSGLPIERDENAKLYVTRGTSADMRESAEPSEGVELQELNPAEELFVPSGGRERPDLGKIVDEVFRFGNEETVAVLVCGPKKMSRELRKYVGKWVNIGREVFWHDESFGL